MTNQQVADKYKLKISFVVTFARRCGVPIGSVWQKPHLDALESYLDAPTIADKARRNRQIAEEILSGRSFKEVGMRYKLTRQRIYQIVASLADELPLKPQHSRESFRRYNLGVIKSCNKLARILKLGYPEVARECGMSVSTVRQILSGRRTYVSSTREYKVAMGDNRKRLAMERVIDYILLKSKYINQEVTDILIKIYSYES